MTRKLLIAGGVVLALVVVVGLIARSVLDPEAIRVAVEKQASAALGQPVTIGGVE